MIMVAMVTNAMDATTTIWNVIPEQLTAVWRVDEQSKQQIPRQSIKVEMVVKRSVRPELDVTELIAHIEHVATEW